VGGDDSPVVLLWSDGTPDPDQRKALHGRGFSYQKPSETTSDEDPYGFGWLGFGERLSGLMDLEALLKAQPARAEREEDEEAPSKGSNPFANVELVAEEDEEEEAPPKPRSKKGRKSA